MQLRQVINDAIIIAYKENVDALEAVLKTEGFKVSIQRATYTEEVLKTTVANTRTLMNHLEAWKRVVGTEGYTLICESDFVPCKGFSKLPVFWPRNRKLAYGYLYQGSPRLLALIEGKYLRNHCAPLVSYVINSDVAEVLLRFYDHEMATYPQGEYFTFDAHLQWWLMGQGCEAFMPMWHYGEHGGLPNTDHNKFGKLPRAGRHRADNLAGPLAFRPQYAKGSLWLHVRERIEARLYGFARLHYNRWIQPNNVYAFTRMDWVMMYLVGLARLVLPYRPSSLAPDA